MASSCLRFRKHIAIMRHVRFSTRSWFGNCVLVLLYNLHICIPNGSLICISSGLSSSSPPVSSFQVGKKLSRINSFHARRSVAEVSSLSCSLALVRIALLLERDILALFVEEPCYWLMGLHGNRKSCSVIDVVVDDVV